MARQHPPPDFPGHVPDRSDPNVDYVIEPFAEFLTRREPRIVKQAGPGHWESDPLPPRRHPTPHGMRLRLLMLERERNALRELDTTQ